MKNGSSHRAVWARLARIGVYIGVVVVLLAGAAFASYRIIQSEPVAGRESATRRSAAVVNTIVVEKGTYRPSIRSLGTVQAARDIVLNPRVSGQILEVQPVFTLGGVVEAGQLLVWIDPADYEQRLIARQSELRQVEAELAIEQGQQRVARREFELLGTEIEESSRSLVLREPQIESLRAKLMAAETAVEQAQLDLARTEIRAPFNGQILSRSADLGSQVAQGDSLARIVGTEMYWVIATVPLSTLRWIEFPEHSNQADGQPNSQVGANAIVRHSTAWPAGQNRQGRVGRLIGEVDQRTRLARVIVEVPDPLGDQARQALVLGTILQVEIEAKPIADVVKLDRAYLRQNDTVWVMQENLLKIRQVEVLFSDEGYAYISEGLAAGDRVVTTSLATVVDGLEIRELQQPNADRSDADGEPAEGDA